MLVGHGAGVLVPYRIGTALIASGYRPRTGESVVDRGNLVAQNIGIGLVEADAVLDDGRIVRMERSAAGIVDAGTCHAAGLDFKRVEVAVAIPVGPVADRIADRGTRQLRRPAAAIGIDATNLAEPFQDDVGDLRHDDEVDGYIRDHDSRHAVRRAAITRIIALAAGSDIRKARLQDRLKLRFQRCLLPQALGLRSIEADATRP